MVLRVEKKLFVIEHPISPASPADSEYLRSGMRFMMLIMRLLVLHSKYNKHNMGKTIGELHALLIEYEKGLPKKAAKPHVMAIQVGRIESRSIIRKSLNAKGKVKGIGKGTDKSYIPKPKNPKSYVKEHPTKDDTCHHCKEVGHWKRNCHVYLAELIKKKKQTWPTDETMGYYFYFPLENKIVVARYAEFFEKNLLSKEVSGRAGELEEIQDEDTSPSEITSEIPMEVKEVEERSLGDLNEPTNYKVALLDPEFDKWLDAMNAKNGNHERIINLALLV
ncbi:retrotransposon protein, putative, ty1-copia subclass [Tanacetum coccineum]